MANELRRKRAYRPSVTITPGRRVTEYRVPVGSSVDPSLDWYLVYTHPKAEAKAAIELQRAGYKTFLPTFRREIVRSRGKPTETIVAMFPRYLFISGRRRVWPTMVDGVQDIVRNGLAWEKMPPGVIEAIVEFQNTEIAVPPVLQPGDRVEILDGPFASFMATVNKVLGNDQAELLVSMFGRQTKARADIAQLIAA